MVHRTGYLVLYLVFIILTIASNLPLQAQYVYTQAGAGLGDKTSAVETSITPTFLCTDRDNNIYVTDANAHLVFKINPLDTLIEVLAGLGLPGPADDSVLARQAFLKTPSGIVYSPRDNSIYIADSDNHCVRKINLDHSPLVLTRFAGTGSPGFAGDKGTATQAQLRNPFGLAIGPDSNLYIADRGNSCIRKVDLSTGIIETLVGRGNIGFEEGPILASLALLNKPQDLCFDSSGNLYISDTGNDRICRVNASDDMLITLAGHPDNTGPETEGDPSQVNLNAPAGIAFDAPNRLWFTDRLNHRVQVLDLDKDSLITQVGNGKAEYNGNNLVVSNATVNTPLGITFDANRDILIADQFNHRIRRIKSDNSSIQHIAGNGYARFRGDGQAAQFSMLQYPEGLASDSHGNLFIADKLNHRIRRVDVNTGRIETVAGNGQAGYMGDGQDARLAQLQYPSDVAVHADSLLYIADSFNDCIREVNLASQIIRTIAGGSGTGYSGEDGTLAIQALFRNPRGIALDSVGNVYIADELNHRIRKVSPSGIINRVVGNGIPSFFGDGGSPLLASLKFPSDVWVDPSGNIWIADRGNQRIRHVNASQDTIRTLAGNGIQGFSGDQGPAEQASLNIPLYLSGQNDTLYISDANNNRIRQVDLRSGIISSKAGTGLDAFNGDTLYAVDANLNFPTGLALDPLGNLYTSSQDHHRVRLLSNQKPPCQIQEIRPLVTSPCDSLSNEYAQSLRVWHSFAPNQGNLVVNGQVFSIQTSPQDIALSNLDSDSQRVDVEAFFDAEVACRYFQADVFQAPGPCEIDPPNFDSLGIVRFGVPDTILSYLGDSPTVDTVDLAALPDSINFLVPDPNGTIGSVYWKVTNPLGEVMEFWDNSAPFRISDDTPFTIPLDLLDSTYTFEIQTFSGANGSGRAGDPKVLNFQFSYLPAKVFSISLIDAGDNVIVDEYRTILPDSVPTIIDLDDAPEFLNMQANLNKSNVHEVFFRIQLEKPNPYRNGENVEPYALFGNNKGNFNSWTPPPVPNKHYNLLIYLEYLHHDQDGQHSVFSDSTYFNFIFTTDQAPRISNFTFIQPPNPGQNNTIVPGNYFQLDEDTVDIIGLDFTPTRDINIRINTFPRGISGVDVTLRDSTGALVLATVDTTFEYTLYPIDTLASTPMVDIRNFLGQYLTLRAMPFTYDVNGIKLDGNPTDLVFRYLLTAPPDPSFALLVAPNPAEDFLSVSQVDGLSGDKALYVYNPIGELVFSTTWRSDEKARLDIRNLNPGIYTVRVDHIQGSYRFRFVKY